jgi:hypothetical protein
MFQTKVVEKIKTHILCSITFFRKSCRLWDNVEKRGTARQATDDNIIRRMRFACWITKATDTHSDYVIFIASPRQQWLRERASVLRIRTLPVLLKTCSYFVGIWAVMKSLPQFHFHEDFNIGHFEDSNSKTDFQSFFVHLPSGFIVWPLSFLKRAVNNNMLSKCRVIGVHYDWAMETWEGWRLF